MIDCPKGGAVSFLIFESLTAPVPSNLTNQNSGLRRLEANYDEAWNLKDLYSGKQVVDRVLHERQARQKAHPLSLSKQPSDAPRLLDILSRLGTGAKSGPCLVVSQLTRFHSFDIKSPFGKAYLHSRSSMVADHEARSTLYATVYIRGEKRQAEGNQLFTPQFHPTFVPSLPSKSMDHQHILASCILSALAALASVVTTYWGFRERDYSDYYMQLIGHVFHTLCSFGTVLLSFLFRFYSDSVKVEAVWSSLLYCATAWVVFLEIEVLRLLLKHYEWTRWAILFIASRVVLFSNLILVVSFLTTYQGLLTFSSISALRWPAFRYLAQPKDLTFLGEDYHKQEQVLHLVAQQPLYPSADYLKSPAKPLNLDGIALAKFTAPAPPHDREYKYNLIIQEQPKFYEAGKMAPTPVIELQISNEYGRIDIDEIECLKFVMICELLRLDGSIGRSQPVSPSFGL
ncbi:hypothetical protein EJ08DRAFT_656351 [Tothia fuscella]|uniref:Uncharacterized protein n=1 Tax=Tothia fuscella TaxID=1048955 RepID=A0A9P4U2W6_9PEZI|nr:hypothetical protein EJ08DRAFT_656351 [Tothia fuscella]